MTKQMTVTIADKVYEQIEKIRKSNQNRSEVVEELLREGLRVEEHAQEQLQEKGDDAI